MASLLRVDRQGLGELEDRYRPVTSTLASRKLPSLHPGEVLMDEILSALGVGWNDLARAIGAPPRRINESTLGGPALRPTSPCDSSAPFMKTPAAACPDEKCALLQEHSGAFDVRPP